VQDAKGKTEIAVKKVEAAELALETARSKGGSQVEQAEKNLKDLRESGKATAEQLKAAEDKLDQARSSAGSTVASKEAAVMSARQRSEKAAEQLKSAEDNLVTAHRKAEDAADNVKAATKRMGDGMEDAESGAKGLKGKLEELVGSSEGVGKGFESIKGKLGLLTGAAGIGGIGAAFATGMDITQATDKMNRQLGLTGDAAKAASAEVRDVMKTGIAGGVDEAAGAIGALNGQFKYLGSEGEQTAAQLADNFIAFSETFGVSIEEATQTAGQLIQNGLAGDVEEAADLMTAAMQRVPAAMRDEMPEIINEYGTNFRALGFDGEEAFGLLVAASEKGKWALDKTGDSLKEFTIRGSDMSESSKTAFESVGLNAEEMANKIAQGGEGARDALKQTAEGLLQMEDPAERANAAIALFGTPLEDLSVDQIPDFLESLSEGAGGMADFQGSSQEMADQMKNSLEGRMNSLKGTVQSLAGDAFMKLWDALEPIAKWASENKDWLTPIAVSIGVFAGAVAVASGAMAVFNAVMAINPFVLIGLAIAAVVAGLIWFFKKTELGQKIWEGFVDVLKGAWDWIKNVFVAGWDWVKEAIPAAWQAIKDKTKEIWDALTEYLSDNWDAIKGTAEKIWNGIKDFFTGLWDGIKEVFTLAVDGIKWYLESYWALITGTITLVWDGIKLYFTTLWEGIKLIFTTAWDIISGFFTTAWQTFTGLVQAVWNGISAFFSSWWSALTGIFTGAWNGISSFLSGSWNVIRDLAVNVWNGIKDSITNAWNATRDAIANAVGAIIGKLGEMVSSAKAKIDEMVGKVVGMKDNIVSALSDAGTWLWNTGKAIVQGAIDGIMSAPNAIYDAIMSLVPDSIKGAVSSVVGWFSADGSIAYANGGVEAYANGGTRGEKHVAQIARPQGPFRVWAEPETGGEAYIPLALSKRARSKAILAKTAQIMGLSVVDHKGDTVSSAIPGGAAGKPIEAFANGGIRTPKEMLAFAKGQSVAGQKASRSLEGAPYVFGGSNWGDCSGAMSAFAAFMTGRAPFPRKFFTGDEGSVLRSYGFTMGKGPSGTLRIGWYNGGPGGGHTAGTLPDGTKVEMGGNRGNGQIGGGAAGHLLANGTNWAWIRGKADGPALRNTNPNRATTVSGTTSGGDANVVEVDSSNTAVAAAATETTPTTWSGIAGDFAKNWTEGMVQDALGVFGISDTLPPIFQAANQYYAVDEKGEGADAVNAQIADAASDSTVATTAAKPASTVENVPEVKVGSLKKGEYKKGAAFFWEEIAKAASERRLGFAAAKIAGATALVESGDPLRMWASSVDTASQRYPYDSIGSDHDSSGLFQQRNNGAWGTVDQRMNARASAGMFLNAMVKKFPGWRTMEPGAVAQGVQVSAFPSKYATKMGAAEKALAKFKGKLPSFSTGTSRVVGGSARGVDDVLSLLAQDEAVLTAEAADVLGRDTIAAINSNPQAFVRPTAQVATAPAVNGGGQGDTYVFQAVNTDELSTMYRRAAAGRVRGAIGAR
jgi:TP901 family phage tail tape measure protein